MEEVFPYNCTVETFFEHYLRLKRPYINAVLTHVNKKESRLTDNPLRVLAQLLYYNNSYRDYDDSTRWKMVFDYDTKMKICSKLNMPDLAHLNSYISQLRRLGIIKKKRIVDWYVVYPEANMKIMFDLKVDMPDEK